ncbi:hypothetical protein IIZ77_01540 [Candidatus Saccharibacteria bacterium]|nr:hypothetical protein [Candidatus Saccharibacteria bacterium]
MATKKSSKSSKTKTTKTAKPVVDHNHIGKCFVAFGLIITALLFGFFYLLGQRKTYMEKQELLAFRGLADSYISERFNVDGERTAEVTDLGVTKDKDLYADFVITRYENDTPVTKQKARLHFQCNQKPAENVAPKGCAFAYWYGEEEKVKAE